MRADVDLFFAGLRGEKPLGVSFGKETGVPEAYLQGVRMREALDKLRETGEGLKETWGPLLDKFKEFMDKIDVEKLGEWIGKFLVTDALTEPFRTLLSTIVTTAADVAIKIGLLKIAFGLGKGAVTAEGAAAGTGLVASLGWAAVGLGLFAGGLVALMAELQNETITEQIERIRKFWTEDWPYWLEYFKLKWDAFLVDAEKNAEEQERINQKIIDVFMGIRDAIQGAIDKLREFFGLQASAALKEYPDLVQKYEDWPFRPSDSPAPGGDIVPGTTSPHEVWRLSQYKPPIPRGFQEFQHGGFIPETGLYGLHANELVLNEGQWRGMLGALGSPSLPADVSAGGGGMTIQFLGDMHIRDETDLERLAQRISHIIGQKADRRARLGA